jgi:hypothetical protein
MNEREPIEPSLFAYIDDYLKESSIAQARLVPLAADSNLIVFLDNFFAQFFQNVLGHEIKSVTQIGAFEATRLQRHNKNWPAEVKRLVRDFKRIGKSRRDLLGQAYGGGTSQLTEFHFKTMPELLTDIEAWAGAVGNEPIREAAAARRTAYNNFLESK